MINRKKITSLLKELDMLEQKIIHLKNLQRSTLDRDELKTLKLLLFLETKDLELVRMLLDLEYEKINMNPIKKELCLN